jgi:hypothetical protein
MSIRAPGADGGVPVEEEAVGGMGELIASASHDQRWMFKGGQALPNQHSPTRAELQEKPN